ncbi:hypothetical protein [Sporosarcina sp. FSL K6-3508]|uniref:ABC superfamily ATP binding cassette transporter permease n=1 Tax=Sporosarcina newyorkensis 2681 TaxID=1027292 RepID=F9DMN3_9BACL|nr:ABC superfamily ATP binding cassette transporter permease [Sporosarcina newyorkensis 2681]
MNRVDILVPIGIGFGSNLIIYLIVLGILKDKKRATSSTVISTILLIVASFIIGRWLGMGLLVISFGMLIAAFFFRVINSLTDSENNAKKS